jgi:Mn2+/Fe2+ NRAMP family transporter
MAERGRAEARGVLQALGPGLLFAGAAVGVSHLVQSTRAGAVYGLAMLGLVVAANFFKYPAFAFAPRYAAATGTSLLEAYRQQGRWALGLYALVTFGTMFTVQAAVTIVAAGLAQALFGDWLGVLSYAALITGFCALVTVVGGFAALDRVMKAIVGVLTISTLAATALVIPTLPWGSMPWSIGAGGWDRETIFFAAALVGWMPTALDIGVWHSLWTLARRQQTGHAPTIREVLIDFDIGYVGTAALAICFVLLGAGVFFGQGVELAASPGGFANQVIALYTENLGAWSRPMIATAAFAVMLSTVLTVTDGFPRALATLRERLRAPEVPGAVEVATRTTYRAALALVCVGSLAILGAFQGGLRALVDLATTLSFLTAPVFSVLNHRAMRSPAMPIAGRPSRAMMGMSIAGIVFQAAFAAYYVWLRFLA